MFWEHFKNGITKEEAREFVGEAISKMMSCSYFNPEYVRPLKKLYDEDKWYITSGGVKTRIGFSPDHTEIRRVTTKISNDESMAKLNCYFSVAHAYSYLDHLGEMRSEIRKIKTQNLPEFYEKLQSKFKEWNGKLQPVSLYIVDCLLRDDGELLRKYRKQNCSGYYSFLIAEDRHGFKEAIPKGHELLESNEIEFPSTMTKYHVPWTFGNISLTSLYFLFDEKVPLLGIVAAGGWILFPIDYLRRSWNQKKWIEKNVFNIARTVPIKMVSRD